MLIHRRKVRWHPRRLGLGLGLSGRNPRTSNGPQSNRECRPFYVLQDGLSFGNPIRTHQLICQQSAVGLRYRDLVHFCSHRLTFVA
jgi:hypothetical protein